MVKKTNFIKLKNGKAVKLKKHSSPKIFGIDAAKCCECEELYVNQTVTFRKYCALIRQNWKNTITNDVNDRAEFKLHYAERHTKSKIDFKEAFLYILINTTKNC